MSADKSLLIKRIIIIAAVACVAVAVTVLSIGMADRKNANDDLSGCYVFNNNIYTNPLSSFMAFGGLPYVYGLDENMFYIANTGNGDVQTYTVDYKNEPVGADEFSSKTDFLPDWLPSLSSYKERYLLAVIYDEEGPKYGLYRMDGEIWLVEYRNIGVWTIYRLVKTGATTLADIERALEVYEKNKPFVLSDWIYEDSLQHAPSLYENQMTLIDVFRLARIGEALTLSDFEPFYYQLTGTDFTVRLYEVVGADSVYVTTGGDGSLLSAELLSRRTYDRSDTVDLREGFYAVTGYMNPLKGFSNITIEDPRSGDWERDLFFEDDYFGSQCRYYLNSKRVDKICVILNNGERMTLKQTLEERRVTVEELVAYGLSNVSMVPIDNPLGGEFPVLHHMHTFSLNEEAFYPSKSFMYVAMDSNGFIVYYDIDELIYILRLYGYDDQAGRLRLDVDPAGITVIAGGNYVRDTVLSASGVESEVGWALNSHTPVWFST